MKWHSGTPEILKSSSLVIVLFKQVREILCRTLEDKISIRFFNALMASLFQKKEKMLIAFDVEICLDSATTRPISSPPVPHP